MARGTLSPVGATRVAANGYHYTKTEDRNWVLTHWLTIEASLGREINPEKESVRFREGFTKADYNNPDAIQVVKKNTTSMRKRLAVIDARIDELTAERDYIQAQLAKL
jgi:hypothetical protein